MRTTFSETVEEFSIGGLCEYGNATATRSALATVEGDNVHVLHELTSCRDNLAAMLCAKFFKLEHSQEWDEYSENPIGMYETGGCATLETDVYNLNQYGLVLYTNAHEKLPSVVDKLQHYANIVGATVPFQLTDLGDFSKYGGNLWLITGDGMFNQPWLHSFIAFALRFHLERGEEELLTDLDTIKDHECEDDEDGEGLCGYWLTTVRGQAAHRYAVKRLLRNLEFLELASEASKKLGGCWGFVSTALAKRSLSGFSDSARPLLAKLCEHTKKAYGMEV